MDDITALLKGKHREVAEMATKVMKKLKNEVEKKGLELSVTENVKKGKSKMIASSSFLENGVVTLGVDLRTRLKRLGAKEKARRKKCKVRFSHIKKNKAFQKNYMKVGVKKLLRASMVPATTWGVMQ